MQQLIGNMKSIMYKKWMIDLHVNQNQNTSHGTQQGKGYGM